MHHTVTRYELSHEADQDLSDIFDYTDAQFGIEQAALYLNDIDALLAQLVAHPEAGRERPDIREGLRSMPCNSHVIFYRILKDHIRVIRVLHGSRDVPRHFG